MPKNSKTIVVPKLRFPGFSGEWQVKKLGDISLKVGSGSTPRGGSAVYKTSGIPFVRSQNVANGKLNMTEIAYIDEQTHSSMFNTAIKPNDVLLNITGASLGRTCVVPADFAKGNLSQHVCIIRLKPGSDPFLVHTILSKPKSLHDLLKTQTGGGKEGLNFQAVRSFKLTLGKLNEQQKISGFFMAVDERISMIDEKIELLKQYKKAVMQKIFTQQIRFKDKNGQNYPDWQAKSLSSISYSETSPLSANKIEARSGRYKVYGASGVLQTLDTYHYENSYIAIVKDGAGAGRISFCEPKSSVLGTMIVIQPRENVDKRFLYNLLSLLDFNKYITGSTIPHVYYKQYSKETFLVPGFNEQQKIAHFLNSIDNLIALQQNKLTHAKLFKKSLLQRMFV